MVRTIIAIAAATAAMTPIAAHASSPVQLASDVFVERFAPLPGGGMARTLERANRLHPGDHVVFVVNWKAAPRGDFTVTNPMPRTVAFQSSADGAEDVSIDGGRSWGQLTDLRVREADGRVRQATPEDVTHLRWRVPGASAARGAGTMTYRGIVR